MKLCNPLLKLSGATLRCPGEIAALSTDPPKVIAALGKVARLINLGPGQLLVAVEGK